MTSQKNLPWLSDILRRLLSRSNVMVSAPLSIVYINSIRTKPLDLTPTSSPLLCITPSYLRASYESRGNIRGSYPLLDPHYTYLDDVPRKMMWSTFFNHTFDFSIAIVEFKRPIILFALPY